MIYKRFYIILAALLFVSYSVYAQNYKVGDIITNSNDGTRGCVFWINPERTGGWMVALENIDIVNWGPGMEIPELIDREDYIKGWGDTAGYANTAILRNVLPVSKNRYAAQRVDFEHGWYLPAAGQLLQLYAALPFIRPKIISSGGTDFKNNLLYWSSTKISDIWVYTMHFGDGMIVPTDQSIMRVARAVRSFSMFPLSDDKYSYIWNTGETGPSIRVAPSGTTDYTLTTVSIGGCSAIASKQILVVPDRDIVIADTIFQGDTYRKYGFHLTQSGLYTRHITGSGGCDISVNLQLTVLDTLAATVFYDTICSGSVYSRYNFSEWETGEYQQNWKGSSGRDSTVILHLYVRPVYDIVVYDTICNGEVYSDNGFHVSESGTYMRHLQTAAGCDSTVTLELTVLPIPEFNIKAVICEGEVYAGHGFTESQPGHYSYTIPCLSGCDSLVTLELAVNLSYFRNDIAIICEGEKYDFQGQTLREPGIYYDSLKTLAGCDSIYRLELTVHPQYYRLIDTVICSGERYTVNGFDVDTSGVYEHALKSVYGCDSITILKLRVAEDFRGSIRSALEDCRIHEYSFVTDQAELSGYSYHWDFGDGETTVEPEPVHCYTDSGDYRVSFTVNTEGLCPQVIIYPLRVPWYSEDFEIHIDPVEIDERSPVIKFSTQCLPDLSYHWDFGDDSVAMECQGRHVYQIKDRTWYDIQLTVNNTDNCPVNQTFRIVAWPKISLVNTFSPNGDGVNDIFMKGCYVKIIDRNGVVVFEGKDGWDGMCKGKEASEDVYFYELQLLASGRSKKQTGYITLMK